MLKTGMMLANRYEIVGRIGSGGMADVYKAMDHKLNRYVAVKVMKSEFSSDSTFVSKFRREAQAAAGLANPNIVNVYDVGEDQGNYYIVMELVEGITLKEYIAKKGKLSVREATSIAIQVCMGLAAAHDQGIVHRDVKPQNIIISTDGKVKVTDFGIARATSSNTISANAMGSVHYSSPEQVRGGFADARSDIYSLGITLYEMVTGRVPFDGETTVAIAIKHLQDEMEPPSKYTPDLPYSLEQIILKCTQKTVDRRYQSMNEVITDLKRSLMEPNGHFVQLTPLSSHARTVMISPAERTAIREATKPAVQRPQQETKTYSSVSAAKKGYEEPERDDDDDTDDGEEVSSKLEKAVTIGGFIVCGIIIVVLIYFIGRAAGLFKFGSPEATSTASVTSTAVTDSSAVEVPNIVGMSEDDAKAAASAAGLGIKYQGEEASGQYAAGLVCRQDPVAGTQAAKNSTIYYYRSTGSGELTIPSNLVGSSQSDAQAALSSTGFTNVQVTTEQSDSVAAGYVISVSPDEGTQATADTTITLTVSSGTGETVTVPNFAGVDKNTAISKAQSAGLIPTIQYSTSNDVSTGEVMSQSVDAYSKVTSGTEIVLTINDPDEATAATPTPTPEVVNTGNWMTSSTLGASKSYTGGAYELVLVQTVNGQEVDTDIAEGDSLSFPYLLQCNGADGVDTGTVYLYEEVDGEYVPRAQWTVSFSQS